MTPKDQKLEDVLYYLIEKTNKVIRRYSQEQFVKAGINITIDQWLVLKKINDAKEINQIELAEALFKDRASITRILTLLKKKKLITKAEGADRRSNQLSLTTTGKRFMEDAVSIVKGVRKKGIDTMQEKEIAQLRASLQKIINNLE